MIDTFLSRYGFNGKPALGDIAAAFSNLPYENVTKIIKESRSVQSSQSLRLTEEVLSDHLRWNTGGTCFSLCNSLLDVLRGCGFLGWIAMADMHYGENIHCAVIVEQEGARYLLDPGYLLHQPIQLPEAGEVRVKTPMNTVLVSFESMDRFSLYTEEGGQRKWRYRIKATPTPPEEFVRHWIHSFSLNSMDAVMLSRVSTTGRLYFRKNQLEEVTANSRRREKLDAGSASELSAVFGIPSDLILQAWQTTALRPK